MLHLISKSLWSLRLKPKHHFCEQNRHSAPFLTVTATVMSRWGKGKMKEFTTNSDFCPIKPTSYFVAMVDNKPDTVQWTVNSLWKVTATITVDISAHTEVSPLKADSLETQRLPYHACDHHTHSRVFCIKAERGLRALSVCRPKTVSYMVHYNTLFLTEWIRCKYAIYFSYFK